MIDWGTTMGTVFSLNWMGVRFTPFHFGSSILGKIQESYVILNLSKKSIVNKLSEHGLFEDPFKILILFGPFFIPTIDLNGF